MAASSVTRSLSPFFENMQTDDWLISLLESANQPMGRLLKINYEGHCIKYYLKRAT